MKSHTNIIWLNDGYVEPPAEWILVNPQNARESRHIHIVTCFRHWNFNIPLFAYCTNSNVLSDTERTHMLALCVRAWEPFVDVLMKQGTETMYDRLTDEERVKLPIIATYRLPDEQDLKEEPNKFVAQDVVIKRLLPTKH